jgi:two-component system OmpR family sensor kinase
VPLAPESAELLAWRFIGTLAAATAAGEKMALTLAPAGDVLQLIVYLPAALAQARDVFAGDVRMGGGALGTGLLGAGFALRLARAEAPAAGGDLVREGLGRMILSLPLGSGQEAPRETPHRTSISASN